MERCKLVPLLLLVNFLKEIQHVRSLLLLLQDLDLILLDGIVIVELQQELLHDHLLTSQLIVLIMLLLPKPLQVPSIKEMEFISSMEAHPILQPQKLVR